MDDLISRQDAIKEIIKTYEYEFPTASGAFDEFATKIVPNVLKNLPSAEPNVRSKTKTAEQFKEEALRAIKNLGGYPYNPDIYWAYRAVLDTPTYKEQGERDDG